MEKIIFFLIIALAVFATWFYLKIASDEFKMLNQRNPLERKSWYYSFLLTHDTGFKEIKTFGLAEYFIKKYQSLVDAFFNQENRINKNKNSLSLIVALLEELISGLVFIIALKSAYDGEILIGTVVLYVNTLAIIQNTTVLFSSNIYSLYNSNLYMDYFKQFNYVTFPSLIILAMNLIFQLLVLISIRGKPLQLLGKMGQENLR